MTPSFQFIQDIFNAAQLYPQKIAVVLDDQCWTYSELVEKVQCVASHLHSAGVIQGQLIYQIVERGFSMICGLLGIICVGGVYCPINPTDPIDRIGALLNQIQGHYILLHEKTRNQVSFANIRHIISLDSILSPVSHVEDTSNLPACNQNGPIFIICTSGTTGRPKAIVHTHKSFSASIGAYAQWDAGLYTTQDQVLQVVNCSWILHLVEVALPLVMGGVIVLLRPGGNLDMPYFSQTLLNQQVTTLMINPGIVKALTNYLETSKQLGTFNFVRNLCITGDYEIYVYSRNWNFLLILI